MRTGRRLVIDRRRRWESFWPQGEVGVGGGWRWGGQGKLYFLLRVKGATSEPDVTATYGGFKYDLLSRTLTHTPLTHTPRLHTPLTL